MLSNSCSFTIPFNLCGICSAIHFLKLVRLTVNHCFSPVLLPSTCLGSFKFLNHSFHIICPQNFSSPFQAVSSSFFVVLSMVFSTFVDRTTLLFPSVFIFVHSEKLVFCVKCILISLYLDISSSLLRIISLYRLNKSAEKIHPYHILSILEYSHNSFSVGMQAVSCQYRLQIILNILTLYKEKMFNFHNLSYIS